MTLKLHRAEVGLTTILALTVAILAAMLAARSMASSELAEFLMKAMAVLPFGFGLVAGIPIVSRELEGRTAQIAWSLYGSRIRWLVGQIVPILLVVGVAVALAAFATSALVDRLAAFPEVAFYNIGSHGLPAVARAVGAFSLGVFVGALIGRALPAVVLGVVITVCLLFVTGEIRDRWLGAQEPLVPTEGRTDVIQTSWSMIAPDGTQVTLEAAITQVPEGEPNPELWLEESGYRWYGLGVPVGAAMQWAWYDTLSFLVVGGASAAGTVSLVNGRRP